MRLLIAERNPRDCWSARVLLSEAGHQVVGAATSLAAAAALAEDTTPDLCIVDARLADGARPASAAERPDRLLLTGSFGSAPRVTLGWLAKPFSALDLLEAVAVCDGLLRAEPPPSRIDRLGGLTLVPLPSGAAEAASPA